VLAQLYCVVGELQRVRWVWNGRSFDNNTLIRVCTSNRKKNKATQAKSIDAMQKRNKRMKVTKSVSLFIDWKEMNSSSLPNCKGMIWCRDSYPPNEKRVQPGREKWSDAETEEHRLKTQGAQFVPTEACSLLLFSWRSLEQREIKWNLYGDMMGMKLSLMNNSVHKYLPNQQCRPRALLQPSLS
jgi:hypothetical protein